MYQSLNLPLSAAVRDACGGWDGLRRDCASLGVDGVEGIWAGEEIPHDFPPDLLVGYHLTFFPDWLDFYRQDKTALLRKFGSMEQVAYHYGSASPETLLQLYRDDLQRAKALNAKYVVFHVSDVSLEEGYTYRWLHSDEAVIDASAEIVNLLLDGQDWPFEFLMENQWWPGLTFTEPDKTARLLDAVHYGRKGLLLDTGHLMNCNPAIRTQADGIAYIHAMLDAHGDLCRNIRGVHLHQSLSGAYVRTHTGAMPPDLPEDYNARFGVSYGHILQIDRHHPWTTPAVADLIRRIDPAYLTHELSASGRKARLAAARRQINACRKGGALLSEN